MNFFCCYVIRKEGADLIKEVVILLFLEMKKKKLISIYKKFFIIDRRKIFL